jgi:micrococcal nuclease
MYFRVLTCPAMLALFASSAIAADYPIFLDYVVDGDTIEASSPALSSSERFRLVEIDAPEAAQPYGQEAEFALTTMLDCAPLRAVEHGRDHYGRILATVYCGDSNINLNMVEIGAAWAYRKYMRDETYLKAEIGAREKHLGLWAAGNEVAPWKWRKKSKQ